MSKRSYRRLAVLAGTALAVGSMAPAMAARVVDVDADADVAVETLDVTDVSLPQLNQIIPGGLVTGIAGSLLATVGDVRDSSVPVLLGDVRNIVGDAQCAANVAVGASLGLGLEGVADLTVGLGGLGLSAEALAGLAGAPFAIVDGLGDCVRSLAGHALGTAGHVRAIAGGVTSTAVTTAIGTVGVVRGVPGTVLTTVGGLTPALGSILNLHVEGNANVTASMLSVF